MRLDGLRGTMNVPAYGGGEYNYQVNELPDDPDGQVAGTIRLMKRYAVEDAGSAGVQRDARECWGAGGGDVRGAVRAVWAKTQGKIKFLRDEGVLKPGTFGAGSDVVEVLVRPCDVANGIGIGDCDDYAMYAASMLCALGVPCAFVTVAGDERNPGLFTHVYVAAYPNGERVAVDASHGEYCGWEARQLRPTMRWREWPVYEGPGCEGEKGGGDGDGLGLGTLMVGVGIGVLVWWGLKGRPVFGV